MREIEIQRNYKSGMFLHPFAWLYSIMCDHPNEYNIKLRAHEYAIFHIHIQVDDDKKNTYLFALFIDMREAPKK